MRPAIRDDYLRSRSFRLDSILSLASTEDVHGASIFFTIQEKNFERTRPVFAQHIVLQKKGIVTARKQGSFEKGQFRFVKMGLKYRSSQKEPLRIVP